MKQYSISIIIPAKNEEKYIRECVASVINQTYPQSLIKVFVCDGNSTDKTREIVTELSTIYPNVHLLINEKEAAPFAFNMGIKASPDMDYIMILGAHSELAPDYISTAMEFLTENNEIACLGGILDNVCDTKESEMIARAMSLPFGVGNAHFRTGAKQGYVDTVAFGIYKRDVFEKVGLFDEELIRNQDDEFNYRITKAGMKIYLLPSLKARYYVRASFKKLFRQYYQYGYWKVFVNKKHQQVTTMRQLFPPAFVLFFLGFPLLILLSGFFGLIYTAVLLLYFAMALFFAITAAKSAKEVLMIAFSFGCLHFGYGLGYLKGLYDVMLLQKAPNNKVKTLTR